MTSDNSSSRKINCPSCKKETEFSKENPFRPFCSERCRLIDLGEWASGKYQIESQDSGSVQDLEEAIENENSRREAEENPKKN